MVELHILKVEPILVVGRHSVVVQAGNRLFYLLLPEIIRFP